MANGARGEVCVSLGGRERRLCLTLGALAEMETGLRCAGVAALAERLRTPAAGDLLVVLRALARGGGERLNLAEAEGLDLREAAEAVAAAFEAAA